jgi:glycosyltransferase involved in cell wall biosynthesis
MQFSIIIPVYNRPDEITELLESLVATKFTQPYEVVIIEDGSAIPCQDVVAAFATKLNISYYYKENSGPGDSRNFGMQVARGEYFLIFDSDCIIPPQYLSEVAHELETQYVDCFGGPDAALDSFSDVQKAINFAMTSFLTTGGIRGGSEKVTKFQPRSFNMGISKKAFEASQGFGNIHPGEDPDLSIRLWKLGFETRLFPKAFVYHKRRIDWEKFTVQVTKFGKARPILNRWYPEYNKLTFFFPTLFLLGGCGAVFLFLFGIHLPILLYAYYFIAVFILASAQYKSIAIGCLSVIAVYKQFTGYGSGFLNSYLKVILLKQKPETAFPELFFKTKP